VLETAGTAELQIARRTAFQDIVHEDGNVVPRSDAFVVWLQLQAEFSPRVKTEMPEWTPHILPVQAATSQCEPYSGTGNAATEPLHWPCRATCCSPTTASSSSAETHVTLQSSELHTR
jgi:hypothetical protein